MKFSLLAVTVSALSVGTFVVGAPEAEPTGAPVALEARQAGGLGQNCIATVTLTEIYDGRLARRHKDSLKRRQDGSWGGLGQGYYTGNEKRSPEATQALDVERRQDGSWGGLGQGYYTVKEKRSPEATQALDVERRQDGSWGGLGQGYYTGNEKRAPEPTQAPSAEQLQRRDDCEFTTTVYTYILPTNAERARRA